MRGPIIDCHTHPLVHERQRLREPWLPPAESYLASIDGLGILALPDKHDGFFFPVCSVHPFDGDQAVGELERVVASGARWLKLWQLTAHWP